MFSVSNIHWHVYFKKTFVSPQIRLQYHCLSQTFLAQSDVKTSCCKKENRWICSSCKQQSKEFTLY